MTAQLRQAIAGATTEQITLTTTILLMAAKDATLAQDDAAVVFAALVGELRNEPTDAYSRQLIAAATIADDRVNAAVADMRGAAQQHPDNPLHYALARELAGAAGFSRMTRLAFTNQLDDTDTDHPDSAA